MKHFVGMLMFVVVTGLLLIVVFNDAKKMTRDCFGIRDGCYQLGEETVCGRL